MSKQMKKKKKKKLREVFFPIQSFSPLAFYIWEDVVDRFYHQLSILFLIEADGPFFVPL
jgi:hypothetical protein